MSANGTSYNESNVKAEKDLSFASGRDTNIKGGVLQGEKVTGTVGNDLNIESKQDSNSYKESNKTAGASIGLSDKTFAGNASAGKIDSNYTSVTDQSGIYAGGRGFDIGVGKNTDLKGGIISSEAEAEKYKLSTGTLTFEDIENKADYKANSVGVNANINNKAEYNEKGVTPNIGMPASGEAESKTKATISEGTIEIRDKENQKQDINKLNRDKNNSLNKLGEIFDKTKIEERQELANLFGELAYNEIHKLADKNGWKEGSAEKNALHALVGGIMSELTGNGFLAGASASTINEMVQQKLAEQFKDEPDKHQWASAIIGGVVSQLVAGKAQAGASTAASGTKNNELLKSDVEQWYFIGDFIKNLDFSNWQEGEPVFAYQVGAGAADLFGAQGGMLITPDKVFFSVGVQGGISAYATDGSNSKIYVLKPEFKIIDFIEKGGTIQKDYFVTKLKEFNTVMKGASMGLTAAAGVNFSYSITPEGYTVISFGTGTNVGVGGNYSITW